MVEKMGYREHLERKLDQLQARRGLISERIFLTNTITPDMALELEEIARDYGATAQLLRMFFPEPDEDHLIADDLLY